MESPHLAFWLTPAAHPHRLLESLVQSLAARYDAPVFQPHLTIAGGQIEISRASETLRDIVAPESCELEVDEVDFSETYTKTLFVRFRLSPELRDLRAAIGEALQLPGDAEFDPHVSLLYKNLPPREKEDLAQGMELPFQRVRFDGMKVVSHPPRITRPEDVEAWETVAVRCLTSPSE